jgi:hypothetical protein
MRKTAVIEVKNMILKPLSPDNGTALMSVMHDKIFGVFQRLHRRSK